MTDLKQIFEERRSINFFNKEKKLEDGLLEKIIDTAATAPSAFNLQPWSVIVVKSEEGKKKLFENGNKQPKFLEAPVTLIITGDRAGYSKDNPMWAEFEKLAGRERTEGAQQFAEFLYGSTPERKIKFAESNAGLLSMSIMYAAKYYGVDSHPASGVDFEGLKKAFDIEGENEVVMLICLGYFDETKTLYPRQKRLGYKEIAREV
ncbi:MAG TPA: nitroreductase family protein [Clostridia bacterium]